MAKTTYQTYTTETPLETYRSDFIRRGAMCAALAKRYPDLAPVGKAADDIVLQIDSRRAALQQAEDDQLRARAIEDAEKLDVVDVYTELRRTLSARNHDVATLLPDAPSVLGRMNAKTFGERADQAVANLQSLPATLRPAQDDAPPQAPAGARRVPQGRPRRGRGPECPPERQGRPGPLQDRAVAGARGRARQHPERPPGS